MFRKSFVLWLPALAVSACVPWDNGPGERRPLVNLQITEDEDSAALQKFIDELDGRGIKATLIVDEYVATEGCDQLQQCELAGHEIMVYGRPDEPPGEFVSLTMLTYAEQQQVISEAKSAIEECLGHGVQGFRSYHFAHNEDTWQILDDLDIRYNLSFVAHSGNSMSGHFDDDWPYEVEGHDFLAVPMHSAAYGGQTKAFCDMPFRSLSAADWEALMKSELTRMTELGLPLRVEFHPYFSANDEGRWNAFTGFLDFAESNGAEFVTVVQMMEHMPAAQ